MNVQDSYNEWSRTYDTDENATRDLDRKILESLLGARHFDSIIEAGCGTGKNTPLLAKLGTRVQAMDFSAGMIARAKEKAGHLSSVTFTVADITQRWTFADRSAGLVTCNLVLEHVKDLASVFSEAARVLTKGGDFFISELHPFRQYAGTVANFPRDGQKVEIPAFTHHISEFLESARKAGFELKELREWWHEKDAGKPPRIVSFLFVKATN